MPAKRNKSKVDEQIDENLKRVYDDVLNEAVPDRFLNLIAQLKNTDTARKPAESDKDEA